MSAPRQIIVCSQRILYFDGLPGLHIFVVRPSLALPPLHLYLQVAQSMTSHIHPLQILRAYKADSRHEPLATPCLGDLRVELINSFKRKAFRLVDDSIDENGAEYAESAPHEEDFCVQVGWLADHVGCCNRDDDVEDAVGSCGDEEAFGTGFEREDLAGNDPGTGTPGAGEEEAGVWSVLI